MVSHATEIIPNLWLGDEQGPTDRQFIEKCNIKFIINCSKDLAENKFGIENIRINVDDRPSVSHSEDNEIMYESLESCVDYIHKCIVSNGKSVLVHCKAGKQRSASVIAAYIMKFGEVDIDKAVYYIRTKRPIAFTPMINFLPALKKYMLTLSNSNSNT